MDLCKALDHFLIKTSFGLAETESTYAKFLLGTDLLLTLMQNHFSQPIQSFFHLHAKFCETIQ